MQEGEAATSAPASPMTGMRSRGASGAGGSGFRPNLTRGAVRKPVPLASPAAATSRPSPPSPATGKRREKGKELVDEQDGADVSVADEDDVQTPLKRPRVESSSSYGGPPPVVSARDRTMAASSSATASSPSNGPPPIIKASTLRDVVRANTGVPMERTGVQEQVRNITRPAVQETVESAPMALGPKVMVDENGEVVIDQQSLTVTHIGRDESASYELVHDDQGNTNFQRHRRKNRREKWTKEQTEQFYQALRKCGTDFTLISLFMGRSRDQIRNKFKKEEKENGQRIDQALRRGLALDEEEHKMLAAKAKSLSEQEKRQREAKERGESDAPPPVLLDKPQPRRPLVLSPIAGPTGSDKRAPDGASTASASIGPGEEIIMDRTEYEAQNRFSDDEDFDRYDDYDEGDYYGGGGGGYDADDGDDY